MSPIGEWPIALLYEHTPAGERVPAWESFTPVWPVQPANNPVQPSGDKGA
jgi:hypothetical protein